MPAHAYILMVIYFLQQLRPPILPVLHELVDYDSLLGSNRKRSNSSRNKVQNPTDADYGDDELFEKPYDNSNENDDDDDDDYGGGGGGGRGSDGVDQVDYENCNNDSNDNDDNNEEYESISKVDFDLFKARLRNYVSL